MGYTLLGRGQAVTRTPSMNAYTCCGGSKHLGSAEPMPPVPYVRIDDNHSRRTTTTRASVGLIVRVAAG